MKNEGTGAPSHGSWIERRAKGRRLVLVYREPRTESGAVFSLSLESKRADHTENIVKGPTHIRLPERLKTVHSALGEEQDLGNPRED